MGGAHLSFDTGTRDIKKAPAASKSQEVGVCIAVFGVSGVCDMWRRVEDRSFQDGSHHEMVNAY